LLLDYRYQIESYPKQVSLYAQAQHKKHY